MLFLLVLEFHGSCELRVTVYSTGYEFFFLHASHELLFNARVVVIVILSTNLDTPWFILNIGNTSSNIWKHLQGGILRK